MQEEIAQMAELLRRGEVVVFPTETVYALAADATNPRAIEHIYILKNRIRNKPLAVFFPFLSMVEEYVDVNESARQVMVNFMPGPITCILPLKSNSKLASNLTSGVNTLGIRMPDHPFATSLLNTYGKPIAATSVNLSSEPAASSADDVKSFCAQNIPFYIEQGQDSAVCGRASTVVDLSVEIPVLLREGDIEFEEIRKIYNLGK